MAVFLHYTGLPFCGCFSRITPKALRSAAVFPDHAKIDRIKSTVWIIHYISPNTADYFSGGHVPGMKRVSESVQRLPLKKTLHRKFQKGGTAAPARHSPRTAFFHTCRPVRRRNRSVRHSPRTAFFHTMERECRFCLQGCSGACALPKGAACTTPLTYGRRRAKETPPMSRHHMPCRPTRLPAVKRGEAPPQRNKARGIFAAPYKGDAFYGTRNPIGQAGSRP